MKKRADRRVRGLPRYDRPADAIGHLTAACANSQVRGVIVVVLTHDDVLDVAACGALKSSDLCWAGATLQGAAFDRG